ncbi:PAS domain-containing protein [Roseixanthobacter pseudopolyaromaticivorans]|uniref:PAS domain-containing protein n=1 Tax=Xanthobacteraceae TaxID=335928 RepID=UPI00372A1FD5
MSEHTSRLLALNEPALAPLLRDDLASFLISVRDGTVVAATAACARLGLREDQAAPKPLLDIVRQVAASPNGPRHLERVRLPAQLSTRLFSCACLSSPLGRLVLFADPEAFVPGNLLPTGKAPQADARTMIEETRPIRFTWEADGDGVIRFLSETAVDGLGLRLGGWLGRSFRQLADAGLLRDSSAIEAALEAGSSFADVLLYTEEPQPRRIVLGGMPLLDGMRRRTGVRGFGILWPPSAFDDTAARMSRSGERDDAPMNVVPLRGGHLTQRERSAFHEIARTLHEAVNGWNAPQREARDPENAGVPPEGVPDAFRSPREDGPEDAELEPATSAEAGEPSEVLDPSDALPDPVLDDLSNASPFVPASEGDDIAPGFADEVRESAGRLVDAAPIFEPAPSLVGSADSLLDRLPLGIAIQQHGRFVRVNRTILGWAGMADTEEFQRTGGVAQRLWRAEAGGQLHFTRAEGEALPVEVRLVSAPWNGETALVHLVRAIEPTSADTHGARASVRHRARHEALDLIPVPVALLDSAGTLQYLNLSAVKLGGRARDALLGTTFASLFVAEDQHLVEALFAAGSQSGRVNASGFRLLNGDGRPSPVDVTIARADHAPEDRPTYCAVFREIAPAPDASAAPAVQDTDALLRRLSHGVREPLNVMFGFVEAVRSGAFGAIGTRRYSKLAEGAVLAGRQLMATLEDIEGLIASPDAPNKTVLDINALVDDAVAHLAGTAQRRRILIRRDFSPQATIRCDGARTAQMVRLLLEEALRGTPEGQYVLISTIAEPGGAEDSMTSVAVLIRDEGASLSEEEIAQALDVTRHAAVADRFGTAGLPFRMARIAALARSVGGSLNLRRGIEGGMLSELRLPK